MAKSTLLVTLLATIAVFGLVGSADFGNAQTIPIPKPSVPEFTVSFIDSSYYNDTYTDSVATHNATYVENKTIVVSIKNQPFTPYRDESGNLITLAYNMRVKNNQDWMMKEYGFSATGPLYHVGYMPTQSNSEYTTIAFSLQRSSGWYNGSDSASFYAPSGATVDFQVKAMVGYATRVWETPIEPYIFTGEDSGWSSTQTIIIPQALPSLSPTANPTGTILPSSTATAMITQSPNITPTLTPTATATATVPEFSSVALLLIALAASLTLVVLKKKRS